MKFSHLEGTPHLFHGLLSQLFTCQSHGQDPEAKLCTQSVVKLKIDDFGLLGNNSSKASVSPPNCGLSFGLDPRPGRPAVRCHQGDVAWRRKLLFLALVSQDTNLSAQLKQNHRPQSYPPSEQWDQRLYESVRMEFLIFLISKYIYSPKCKKILMKIPIPQQFHDIFC